MKKIIIGLIIGLSVTNVIHAQDENDAIRYGYTHYFGTARGMSIGSALGSIGGDFSTLSVNPAGIGIYRKGEFSFTPSFSVNHNDAAYQGNNSSSNSNRFNFSQVGLVLTKAENNLNSQKKWKTVSFAFGMNRQQNFTNSFAYSGKNNQSSIVNKWANDFNDLGGLNNTTLNNVNFPAYAAYQVFLIDYDNLDSSLAKSYVPLEGEGLLQSKTVTEKGGVQEYVISGGGNYMEKLMLGATVGIVNERYTRSSQYKEEDISGNLDNDFKYLKFGESLITEGTGINLKVGMIYKFNKNFRLGFALHSPTRINFTDQSRVDMESHTENLNASPVAYYNQDTAQAFNYSMNTPYKAIASGTFLFSRFGFLTADLEYVDYASMKYDMGIGYEDLTADLDAAIQRVYRATSNIRVGAEAKLDDISLRLGYAYYGSPYKNSTWDASTRTISGGIGYRAKAWFLDLALVQSKRNQIENNYFLYNGTSPRAVITRNTANVVITMGWKF